MAVIYDAALTENMTDPWVRRDGGFKKSAITKLYTPQTGTYGSISDDPKDDPKDEDRIQNYNSERYDAIEIPLIKLNNILLEKSQIKYFKLSCVGFLPELTLVVDDINRRIGSIDIPGYKNKVTVVMTMPINGAYEKISIDFYITDTMFCGGTVTYTCKLWMPEFNTRMTKAWKFDGANDPYCKLPPNKYPTTFEMLYEFAKETKLGLASTDNCMEINDRRIRIAQKQTYPEVIEQHLKFGGLDDESIFDAWISLYGYIIMVNVPWVMNYNIEDTQLTMKHCVVRNMTDGREFQGVYPEYWSGIRMLTNDRSISQTSDTHISAYRVDIDRNRMFSLGTNSTFYTLNHVTAGGTNSLSVDNKQTKENSEYGKKLYDDYKVDQSQFIGCEMGGDQDEGMAPVLLQEKRRDLYFANLRSKQLIVTMNKPNFAFLRGMLVNVGILEYNRENKFYLARMMKLEQTRNFVDSYDYPTLEESEKIAIENPNYGINNIALSGIYYIDGIEFEYSIKTGKIQETMYLLRKDADINFMDMAWGNEPEVNYR